MKNHILIYSNPSTNVISIHSEIETEYKVLDHIGRELAQWKAKAGNNLYDVYSFSKGYYNLIDMKNNKSIRFEITN